MLSEPFLALRCMEGFTLRRGRGSLWTNKLVEYLSF